MFLNKEAGIKKCHMKACFWNHICEITADMLSRMLDLAQYLPQCFWNRHVHLLSMVSRRGNSTGPSTRRTSHVRAGWLIAWNPVTCQGLQMRSQQHSHQTVHCGLTATDQQTYDRSLVNRVTKVAHVNCTSGWWTGGTTSGRNLFVRLTCIISLCI